MVELLGPILLLGLADSLNPVTIAVGVLIAAGRRPVARLATYTTGIYVTYFLGGLLLTLGPAALLQQALHHVAGVRTHIAEIVIGVGALAVAGFMATRPPETVGRHLPGNLRPSGTFALGAVVTVIDLPTALMYFGAIALMVGADLSVASRVVLLVVFNLAYVAPLIGIAVIVGVMRERAEPLLGTIRDFVARWGHRVLAALTGASGAYLIYLGVSGLA
jgi:cytochrome c biogenesis protein CcdA